MTLTWTLWVTPQSNTDLHGFDLRAKTNNVAVNLQQPLKSRFASSTSRSDILNWTFRSNRHFCVKLWQLLPSTSFPVNHFYHATPPFPLVNSEQKPRKFKKRQATICGSLRLKLKLWLEYWVTSNRAIIRLSSHCLLEDDVLLGKYVRLRS